MAPKAAAAAKPAAKRPAEGADNPPAKKGGAGLGQGRKKSNGLGKASGGTSQVSLAMLLGARTPSSSPAPAPAPPPASAPAPSPATAPAEPFASSQALGECWHAIIGYGTNETDEAEVEKALQANRQLVQRVIATDENFFFGPAKELLLEPGSAEKHTVSRKT